MGRLMTVRQTLMVVIVFSIAMGLLESAVVVYLREIYYPEGFSFPLEPAGGKIIATELYRELATLVMLIGIGILAGRSRLQKFAYFLLSFAIWDIFYYVFLKLLIGWPDSFFTWDVLFLIPVTWVGPVIGPVIVSLSMIVLSAILIMRREQDPDFSVSRIVWYLLIAGSIIIILSFTWDYSAYLLNSVGFKALFEKSNQAMVNEIAWKYVPEKFNWILFVAGELIIVAGIALVPFQPFQKK